MLYRRHTRERQVPASDRFAETGDTKNATTSDATTAKTDDSKTRKSSRKRGDQ